MNDITSCAASEPFALRVIGDEMAPEFVDGHVIVIDPGGKVASGCFAVAKHGGDAILRQLFIEEGSFHLRSLDGRQAEIVLAGGLDDIVGVVSQRSGKRRSQHKRYDV